MPNEINQQLVDCTPFLDTEKELKKFSNQHGYLFFRNFLPVSDVLSLRQDILKVMSKLGWLDESYPIYDAFVKPETNIIESPTSMWEIFYKQILQLQKFQCISLHPKLTNLVKCILDEPVFPHCRTILRAFSRRQLCTPPHRDYTWTGGTTNCWTAWIPLGDLREEMGGLTLISGSHQKVYPFAGEDERSGYDLKGATWTSANDYKCGDVVLFHSKTIHAGRGNNTNAVRLSMDVRLQAISEPIREDSLQMHWNGFGLTWEDVYANWSKEADEMKYYWQRLPLKIVNKTPGTYFQDLKQRYILNSLLK